MYGHGGSKARASHLTLGHVRVCVLGSTLADTERRPEYHRKDDKIDRRRYPPKMQTVFFGHPGNEIAVTTSGQMKRITTHTMRVEFPRNSLGSPLAREWRREVGVFLFVCVRMSLNEDPISINARTIPLSVSRSVSRTGRSPDRYHS